MYFISWILQKVLCDSNIIKSNVLTVGEFFKLVEVVYIQFKLFNQVCIAG